MSRPAVSVSREDSLPNFLIEAQASGLPVVAYDCRGVEETCIPGRTGRILPPEDHQGLLANLLELANNPQLRNQLGHAAPAFARERFARGPQAESILRFMEGLLNNPA